jgi:hypothetical protein
MGPGHDGHFQPDPERHERALLAAMRWTMLASVCLPAALAGVGASATGQGIAFGLAWPLAALAAIATAVCLWQVIVLWRTRPRRDDEDDHGGWWRRHGDNPLLPGGGPGGLEFDWRSFERQFWSHVHAGSRSREEERVPVGASAWRRAAQLRSR